MTLILVFVDFSDHLQVTRVMITKEDVLKDDLKDDLELNIDNSAIYFVNF